MLWLTHKTPCSAPNKRTHILSSSPHLGHFFPQVLQGMVGWGKKSNKGRPKSQPKQVFSLTSLCALLHQEPNEGQGFVCWVCNFYGAFFGLFFEWVWGFGGEGGKGVTHMLLNSPYFLAIHLRIYFRKQSCNLLLKDKETFLEPSQTVSSMICTP